MYLIITSFGKESNNLLDINVLEKLNDKLDHK